MIMPHIGTHVFIHLYDLVSSLICFPSLNIEKRHRDEVQHKSEVERLQKQIHQARTNYPTREYDGDFAKQQDFKRRISRFPFNNK